MTPTVFFVVPIYNVEAWLRRCVDSLLAQRYENCRIILVNDGSPDGCGSICREYADRYERVLYIEKENSGVADARSAGLERCLAEGSPEDYVSFVDPDDFIHPDFAGYLLDACLKNGCRCAQCMHERGTGDAFSPFTGAEKPEVVSAKEALLGYRLRMQCTVKLYALSVVRNERFPSGRWNEDECFTYRAVYHTEKIFFSDLPYYYYFQRPGSIMHTETNHFRDHPHSRDWIKALEERIDWFAERGEDELVLKVHEKFCSDVILRYSEQMLLPKEQRVRDEELREFLRLFRENYALIRKAPFVSAKRRAIYLLFRLFPWSAVAAARFRTLRTK